MNPKLEAMRDELARLTAELDQVQSTIDEARQIFEDDPICAMDLDLRQDHVDRLREEVRLAELFINELS